MSLGWQCESAILPSKAKPIKVDSTSILGLKALLYSEEQKRLTKKQNGKILVHEGVHRGKLSRDKDFVGRAKTNGNDGDKPDDDDKEARVLQALTAKSKLYDEIASGDVAGVPSVLNFDCQRRESSVLKENDEFGRVIPQSQQQQQQYQWSTGQQSSVDTYKSEKLSEREFQRQVEERIQLHTDSKIASGLSSSGAHSREGDVTRGIYGDILQDRGAHPPADQTGGAAVEVSAAARVKTQWEKTLHSSARGFLEEVHRDTEAGRAAQLQQQQPARVGGHSSVVASGASSGGAGSRKRAMREDRLELLRAKQQKVTASAAAPATADTPGSASA